MTFTGLLSCRARTPQAGAADSSSTPSAPSTESTRSPMTARKSGRSSNLTAHNALLQELNQPGTSLIPGDEVSNPSKRLAAIAARRTTNLPTRPGGGRHGRLTRKPYTSARREHAVSLPSPSSAQRWPRPSNSGRDNPGLAGVSANLEEMNVTTS
jgi:hypothetical protein